MAKITYNNANVVPNYDTFAGWLTKTNMIMYDMGNFVLTTSTTSSPDITTGNAFVNGFFGSNTVYVTTAIQGGTPNTAANLAISSGLTVTGQAWLSSNVNIAGSANVATVLNVTGNTNIANLYSAATINAANLVSNNTITANTLNSLVKITAPVANVTTANIGTLGVTGSTTLANLNIGTSAAANLQANASTITFAANTAANGSINATSYTGTAANATLFAGLQLANLQAQITGNAAAAYTNAVTFAANASNLGNGTVPNGRLSAQVVNTSGDFTIAGVINYTSNVVVTGSATSALVVGNNTTTNVFANATNFLVRANSVIGSVSVNTTAISVGNATVYTTINTTAFSGTANNANSLGGASLTTIQDQITGNAATAYTNAVTFAANASNLGNGTVPNGRLSGQVVNTSGDFTMAGIINYTSNVVVTGSATSALVVGNNTSTNVFANSTSLLVRANSVTGSVSVNTTAISVGNASVSSTINATSFTGTAANATLFAGQSLSTIETRITGNASAAYTNATAYVTAGGYTVTGNVGLSGSATSQLLISTISNTSPGITANSTQITLATNTTVSSLINATSFTGTAANATLFGGHSVSTVQNWISTNVAAVSSAATTAAATAYTNAVADAATDASTKAGTAYSNAVAVAANASNLGNGTVPNARLSGQVVNTSGDFTMAGVINYTANVVITGGGTSRLTIGNNVTTNLVANSTTLTLQANSVVGSVFANTTTIRVGNGTVYTTVNTTAFSGDANNASYLGGVAAADYQTEAGLSANVAVLTANAAGYLGNSSGTYANILSQISSSANAAYSNALSFVSASLSNGSYVAANASYSANTGAIAGVGVNASSPSDGFVLAYDSGQAKIVFKNPSNISVALNSNTVVANSQLQAGSNGTAYATEVFSNTTASSIAMRANSINVMVDSGFINLNSTVKISNDMFSGNSTVNTFINSTSLYIYSNASVYTTVNSTAFSGTANNATYLNGLTLSTIQSQITGNAATAYTNAVSNAAAIYQTKDGLSANVAELTANAAGYLGNSSGTYANILSQISSSSGTAFSNAIANAAASASALYFPKAGGSISGDVTISGNLNVTGTTVYANVTNLDVKDLNITVAKGAASNVASDGAGITVDIPNAQFFYSGSANTWNINRSLTPGSNTTFALGSTTMYWNNVFTTALNFSGTASINATTYTGTANNATNLGGATLATIQSQITGNAATAYTNATSYVTAGGYTITNTVTHNANVVMAPNTTILLNANTASSPTISIGNVVNMNTTSISVQSAAASSTNTSIDSLNYNAYTTISPNVFGIGTFGSTGGLLKTYASNSVANVSANTLAINSSSFALSTNVVSGANASISGNTFYINTTALVFSNGSSNIAFVNAANYTGTANNASNFDGLSSSTWQGYISGNASSAANTAYTNAITIASNGSNITSGTVAAARLGSGTANSTTVLYGNNVWATIPSQFSNGTAYIWSADQTFNTNAAFGVAINIGNTASNLVINTTATVKQTNVGTASNTFVSFVSNSSGLITRSVSINAVANTTTLSATLNTTSFQLSSNILVANVSTTANNLSVNTSGLSFSNGTAVQATLVGNTYSGTANNASNFNGQPASFYTNATNITTGTVAPARLGTGTTDSTTVLYGNGVWATVPTSSFSNGTAYTWSAIQTFNANVSLTGNTTNQIVVGSATINATTYSGTANNASNFNGQPASFYTNASNITTGTVAAARLGSGTADSTTVLYGNGVWATIPTSSFSNGTAYTWSAIQTFNANVSLTGNATNQIVVGSATINATTYSGTANNATNFGGQPASYYTNATNLSTGTVPTARLATGTANSTTALFGNGVWASAVSNGTAYTWSAVQTFNANVSLTGNATSQIVIGSATINATTYSGTSNNATNLGGSSLATVQGQITGNAATAYSNATAYVTAGGYTVTNTVTHSANISMSNNHVISPTLKGYKEFVNALSISTATQALDLSGTNIFNLTLANNTTLSFTNPPATGTAFTFMLHCKQDATGNRVVTWPASVKWPNNSAPTLSTGANKIDVLNFLTIDGGTTYIGALSLANVG